MSGSEKEVNFAESAVAVFDGKRNCAQSICSAFAPALGMPRETALAASCALGAGVAGEGNVCGVVSGAILMIGLKYGEGIETQPDLKLQVMEHAKDFVARFKAAHGSIACRDLIGCDLSTPAGLQKARDEGRFIRICRNLVGSGASILEDFLRENERQQ